MQDSAHAQPTSGTASGMPFRRLSKPLATNPVFKKRFDELEFDAMEIMDDVEETAATVNSDEVPSTTTPMGALASVAGLAAGAAAGLAAFPLDVVGRGMQSTGSILKGQGLGIDRFSAWDETERAEAEAEAETAAEALAMAREQSRRAEEAMARSAIDVARAIEAAKVAAGAEVSAAKAMAAAAERALEVEREKRINHTASAAARRMLRASISRAWEQWTDITRTRARNLRLQCGWQPRAEAQEVRRSWSGGEAGRRDARDCGAGVGERGARGGRGRPNTSRGRRGRGTRRCGGGAGGGAARGGGSQGARGADARTPRGARGGRCTAYLRWTMHAYTCVDAVFDGSVRRRSQEHVELSSHAMN